MHFAVFIGHQFALAPFLKSVQIVLLLVPLDVSLNNFDGSQVKLVIIELKIDESFVGGSGVFEFPPDVFTEVVVGEIQAEKRCVPVKSIDQSVDSIRVLVVLKLIAFKV